jgi:hypothetical protein
MSTIMRSCAPGSGGIARVVDTKLGQEYETSGSQPGLLWRNGLL